MELIMCDDLNFLSLKRSYGSRTNKTKIIKFFGKEINKNIEKIQEYLKLNYNVDVYVISGDNDFSDEEKL